MEDLHTLWWECCKERNRIATEAYERNRLEAGYGDYESKRRDIAVSFPLCDDVCCGINLYFCRSRIHRGLLKEY